MDTEDHTRGHESIDVEAAFTAAAAATSAQRAIDCLLPVEKYARMKAADDEGSLTISASHLANVALSIRILIAIAKICLRHGDVAFLKETLLTMAKRRGQPKTSVAAMLQTVLDAVPGSASLDQSADSSSAMQIASKDVLKSATIKQNSSANQVSKLNGQGDDDQAMALLTVVREVSEGRIFLEAQRARATDMLASRYAAQGQFARAADLLDDLQIETFGSVSRRDKACMLMRQLRYTMAIGDTLKANLVLRKINPAHFDQPTSPQETSKDDQNGASAASPASSGSSVAEKAATASISQADSKDIFAIKRKQAFLSYRIALWSNDEDKWLDVAKDCLDLFYQEPSNASYMALGILYTMVAKLQSIGSHDNGRTSMLAMLLSSKDLRDMQPLDANNPSTSSSSAYKALLEAFLGHELISPAVLSVFIPCPELSLVLGQGIAANASSGADHISTPFSTGQSSHVNVLKLALRQRAIQHNIIVISSYFANIRIARLAELIGLSSEEAEQHLSRLIVDGVIRGVSIDQATGIVTFSAFGVPSSNKPMQLSLASGTAGGSAGALDAWKGHVDGVMATLYEASVAVAKILGEPSGNAQRCLPSNQ